VFQPALQACQGHLLQLQAVRLLPIDPAQSYSPDALSAMAREGLAAARLAIEGQASWEGYPTSYILGCKFAVRHASRSIFHERHFFIFRGNSSTSSRPQMRKFA